MEGRKEERGHERFTWVEMSVEFVDGVSSVGLGELGKVRLIRVKMMTGKK